jgi:hypothetical protein
LSGKSKPVFFNAARARSLLSFAATSGRPTVEKRGEPPARDVDLHLYRVGIDSEFRSADDLGEHGISGCNAVSRMQDSAEAMNHTS